MAPPTAPLNLDVDAVSGICGSISIACWVVVFSPQIVENFRRGSADGLSLQFVIVWLLGDVFNILGAVLQGVLPTMIILAVYYTIADLVLLGQCFYYRGFTWRDEIAPPPPKPSNGNGAGACPGEPHERTGLLAANGLGAYGAASSCRRESWSSQSHHLSPAVPFVSEPLVAARSASGARADDRPPTTRLQTAAFNALMVLMVCTSGVAGWYMSRAPPARGEDGGAEHDGGEDGALGFSLWGQIFGYFCAALYLGSRVPQILLNWRRKSTEGVSMLFFIFACLGNLTYVLSIFAFEPACSRRGRHSSPGGCEPGEAARAYWQYILVNLSWLVGSLGTLLLDMAIFVQFFVYNKEEDDEVDYGEDDTNGALAAENDDAADISSSDGEHSMDDDRWDPRPILQRNSSNYSR